MGQAILFGMMMGHGRAAQTLIAGSSAIRV
jgi:hypothetical protein